MCRYICRGINFMCRELVQRQISVTYWRMYVVKKIWTRISTSFVILVSLKRRDSYEKYSFQGRESELTV